LKSIAETIGDAFLLFDWFLILFCIFDIIIILLLYTKLLMLTNQQKNILLSITANPFFIALPITFLIILFLPNLTSKYKIELKSKNNADKQNSKIGFYDLNNDGKDERVIEFPNSVNGEASIKITHNEGLVYETWNFHGNFQSVSNNFYCTDFDNDGYVEIFVFYYRDDSVFLTAIQPFPNKKLIIQDKLITTVWKRNEEIDYIISDFNTIDLNRDSYSEIIFLFKAGYSRQPRIIVSVDIHNDIISKSKSIGAKPSYLTILDINGDSIPELFTGSNTTANIHDSLLIAYNDYKSYFLAYNNKLKFLFPPIINPNYPSTVQVCKYKSDIGEPLIAVLFNKTAEKNQIVNFYDENYKVIYSKKLMDAATDKSNIISYMANVNINEQDYILLGIRQDKFILINEKGDEIKRQLFEDGTSLRLYQDLNKDGKKEFIFFNSKLDLFIYDHNLEHPLKYENLESPFESLWSSIGVKHNGSGKDEIFLKTNQYLYLYTYETDNYYYMKYPLWLLLYVIVSFILWFTQRMQRIQTLRKQRLEDTINSLQLKTIKSQMDPHFMFNVLNGLANNVAKGSSDEAYSQILRFSKLLRSMMSRSERIDISLKEEIDFVKNYLELEKFRFKDDFEYAIEINETVDTNSRIPRMLIQLLVENSIKHGLRNKIGLKSILIKAYIEKGNTRIIVEDNGIGRKKAKEISKTTGKGLKIIEDMIRLNKKLTGKEIILNYTDLYNDKGEPSGTSVEVLV